MKMMNTNPIRILFLCAWAAVMVTGGLAALCMLLDNMPGVMTRHFVHALLETCGSAAFGMAVWSLLFGKKEQSLSQLGLATISVLLFLLALGFGKMIK